MEHMVYAHEHITIDLSGQKGDADCRLDDRELTKAGLLALKAAGVDTVIDQTAIGMGRDIHYTQKLAEEVGIKVQHATGFYKEPFLPPQCYTMDEQAICRLFLEELQQGIEGTHIRAGHIGEIGTGKDAIAPIEELIFRAAARAHLESGAPICTHTTLGLLGREQLVIFKSFGVDLSHVVLSHIDLSADVDYMLQLLDTGVNIAFDTVGKNNYQLDTDRVKWLTELCQRGHAGQIVMSMDLTRKSNCRELGYDYLVTTFIPMLMEAGFRESWLHQIMVENPRRIYRL